MCEVLRNAGFLGQPREITLTIWSDCAGEGSEMFAGSELADALKDLGYSLRWNLFCACESDTVAEHIIKHNHHPKHFSEQMEHRSIEAGTFWCTICNASHAIPTEGIDIYFGTYPCTPWSRRGQRLGWSHPDIKAFRIGIRTVAVMKPCMWFWETTEGVDDQRENDDATGLEKVEEFIATELAKAQVSYVGRVVRKFNPTWCAYPVQRPRAMGLYWHADMGSEEKVLEPLKVLMSQSLPMPHDYITFLGLVGTIDWSRLDEYPTSEEGRFLRSSTTCTCAVNPMTLCDAHPCTCGKCGPKKLGCAWRRKAKLYIESHLSQYMAGHNDGGSARLTYLQVLQIHGEEGPRNARERNMLNIIALLPRNRPLGQTCCVIDRSQSIDWLAPRWDGTIPTLATNSVLHCFRTGSALTTFQLASLMGLRMEKMDVSGISETAMRQRLGLSIHISVMGLAMLALAAPFL